jgi:hypothetical protein
VDDNLFNVVDYIYDTKATSLHPIALFVGLVGLITHCFTKTGIRFANFLLGATMSLIRMVMEFDNQSGYGDGTLTSGQSQLVAETPSNLHTALSQFSLDGKTDVWAVCTACKFTHAPQFNPNTGSTIWPSHCEYRNASGVQCEAPLLKKRGKGMVPKCPYLVPSLCDYIGRLLSDPDIEALCNEVVDNAFRDGQSVVDGATNIFTSAFAQQFKDRDGIPFLKRDNRIRLLFTLHYDQFNPKGVRVRGNSASVGVLNLALLNLPPPLRYLPEHIFMTLLPGPTTPLGHELNHFLRPIVDQLVPAWERGIRLSRTALQPKGAVVDLAVAYETADLLAARHLAGLGGATSNWLCSICSLFGRQNVWNVDWDSWEKRKPEDMKKIAESWRDAPSEEQRDGIFKEHGIRWTELWRLPYYDPTKMIVVDPMHCLLLGLILYFCRFVLGLQSNSENTSTKRPAAFQWDWEEYWAFDCDPGYAVSGENEIKMVSSIHRLLERPITDEFTFDLLSERLWSKNLAPLRFVVHSLELPEVVIRGNGPVPARTKAHFAEILVSWVSVIPLQL